jgi:DNA-binding MarR family transcriptional regulator
MPPEAEIPLARLFAIAFRALMDRVHAQLAARGYPDVGSGFGYVLLEARDRPLTGNEVAQLMGVTKQAASKLIDAMEHARYLERYDHPDDARSKLVRITPKGKRLLRTVEEIYRELEAEWSEAIGMRELSRLRSDLTRALRALHGGSLPPVRPAS